MYQISQLNVGDNNPIPMKGINTKNLHSKLNGPDKESDQIGAYAISGATNQNEIIIGVLSQSYAIDLIKFKEDSKEEIPIKEDSANDNKTYFFIDCKKGNIYIHNRRYTPNELNPNLTVNRLEKILDKYLSEKLNRIILIKANINYGMKEIENYFRESFVKSVEFHNIGDFKLEKGTKLHNPRLDLDEAVSESWNDYSSENVDSIKITAKKDKSIAKNPIANIGIKLAEQHNQQYEKILKSIAIIESGQESNIKPKGNEYLIIPISDISQPYTEIFTKILNWISKRKI